MSRGFYLRVAVVSIVFIMILNNAMVILRMNNKQDKEKGGSRVINQDANVVLVGDRDSRDRGGDSVFKDSDPIKMLRGGKTDSADAENDMRSVNTKDMNSVEKYLLKSHTHASPDEEAANMYGSTTRSIGFDNGTCERFRKQVPEGKRIASVAGLFNTGTNYLSTLLQKNCEDVEVAWQVPWGKHNPLVARGTHWAPMYEKKKDKNHPESTLAIVAVKDPLTWMNSMCKSPYAAMWEKKHVRCPNFLDEKGEQWPVKVQYQPPHKEKDWGTKVYKGLVDMWNQWYNDYHDTEEFYHVIVRYEDFLFRAPEVVKDICECAGGKAKDTFVDKEDAAKGHGHSVGKSGAAIKYGDEERRVRGYKDEDLRWFDDNIDKALLEELGYKLSGIADIPDV